MMARFTLLAALALSSESEVLGIKFRMHRARDDGFTGKLVSLYDFVLKRLPKVNPSKNHRKVTLEEDAIDYEIKALNTKHNIQALRKVRKQKRSGSSMQQEDVRSPQKTV